MDWLPPCPACGLHKRPDYPFGIKCDHEFHRYDETLLGVVYKAREAAVACALAAQAAQDLGASLQSLGLPEAAQLAHTLHARLTDAAVSLQSTVPSWLRAR